MWPSILPTIRRGKGKEVEKDTYKYVRNEIVENEIKPLRKYIKELEAAIQKNCKHFLVGTQPLICGFFDDGPRYRQECILTACPAIEEVKDNDQKKEETIEEKL